MNRLFSGKNEERWKSELDLAIPESINGTVAADRRLIRWEYIPGSVRVLGVEQPEPMPYPTGLRIAYSVNYTEILDLQITTTVGLGELEVPLVGGFDLDLDQVDFFRGLVAST